MDTNYIQMPSNFQQQKDSVLATIRRAGEYLADKADALATKLKGVPDSLKNDPDYLKKITKEKFYKLTRHIKVPVITPAELMSILQDSNLILLDIREETEQKVSMLPGAYTTKSFRNTFNADPTLPSKTIVAYCTIGVRSGEYAQKLQKMGLKVKNLEGGILGWSHIQGPLIRIRKDGGVDSTKSVHTYSKGWNTLNPHYRAIW